VALRWLPPCAAQCAKLEGEAEVLRPVLASRAASWQHGCVFLCEAPATRATVATLPRGSRGRSPSYASPFAEHRASGAPAAPQSIKSPLVAPGEKLFSLQLLKSKKSPPRLSDTPASRGTRDNRCSPKMVCRRLLLRACAWACRRLGIWVPPLVFPRFHSDAHRAR
jgi:hypothetical protein